MTTATVEKDHALANAKAHLDSIIELSRKYSKASEDDEYNLIAIGKLSEPVKNDPDLETTFVVRFDA